MIVEDIWSYVFNYDTYSKGGEFSASDVIAEPLMVKLRKENPNHISEVKTDDKISAWVGTACHGRAEEWLNAENDFDTTGWESEVKLKFKNLSGTADVRIDEAIILDYKTGKEANIRKKILEIENDKRSQWQEQLSIYTYLNHKQHKKPYQEHGYIAWLCVDTNKHGVMKVELLPKDVVAILIKEFMVTMEKPVGELEQCNLCVQFMHKFCGVRSICPKWNRDDDMSSIDNW